MEISKIKLTAVLTISLLAGVTIGFVIEYYNHFLAPMDTLAFIFGIFGLFLLHWEWKSPSNDDTWKLFLVTGGFLLGSVLNNLLSPDYFAQPVVTSLVIMSFSAYVWLTLDFFILKNIKFSKKLSFFVLGATIFFLISAFLGFVSIILAWLPARDVLGESFSFIIHQSATIINILKSLFLASFFNLLDRLAKLSEKQ